MSSCENIKSPVPSCHHQCHGYEALSDHGYAFRDHLHTDKHMSLSQEPQRLGQQLLHSGQTEQQHGGAVVRDGLRIWDLQEPQPHRDQQDGPYQPQRKPGGAGDDEG